ncbi:MAG: threonine/serine exporter family protein [Veillonella sp.]|nr:threonine/serine exporter family protein [Veillonella sp.]
MKQFTLEEKNEVLENPFIHIHRKLDVLLNIGKLLMECGADTNRIIEEMLKAATFMGIPHDYLNIHISYTTIMVNLLHKERSITVFRKTPVHVPNMAMINAVSKLTWRAFERHYSLTTYEQLISKLDSTIPTVICSLIGYFGRTLSVRFGCNEYVGIAIGGFAAMVSAYGFYSHIEQDSLVYVLVCCTLFMIPGVPLINSVIDTINNHILSGITRAIRTILIVGSMTLGMAMALYFSPMPAFSFVDIKPHVLSIEQIIGSFTAAASFAVLFNAPVRLLVSIGIGGVLCVFTRNLLAVEFGFSIPGATFVGAAVMSVIYVKVSTWLRTSSTIIIVPSAIALMPGILYYRFLFDILHINALSESGLLHMVQNGVTGILTIVSIAVGVAIPNVLAQKYLKARKERRIQQYLATRHINDGQ